MRLKTYSGPTMQDVMAQVRKELGPDAIIVSRQEARRGGPVKIVAAIDGDLPQPRTSQPQISQSQPTSAPSKRETIPPTQVTTQVAVSSNPSGTVQDTDTAAILDLLDQHGVPAPVRDRLGATVRSLAAESDELALAAALDAQFRFLPLPGTGGRPLMMAGTPGSGKTSTIARLAAAACLEGRPVRLITLDTERSGGIEQLSGYGHLLNLDVMAAGTPAEASQILERTRAMKASLTLIDTPGVNAFLAGEMDYLKEISEATGAEAVAVVAAGGDAVEASEIAHAFAGIGVRRFAATRLDTTRRLGSLIGLAQGGPLAFSCVSASPYIGDGLQPINPLSLARLLMAMRQSATAAPSNSSKLAAK